MSTRSDPRLVETILTDLRELHVTWMSLVFPRQREGRPSVLGAWRPSSLPGRAWYSLWSAIGTLALVLVYPFALAGFGTRFYVRRIDRVAASLGIVGVVLVSILAWGALVASWTRRLIDGRSSRHSISGRSPTSSVMNLLTEGSTLMPSLIGVMHLFATSCWLLKRRGYPPALADD